MTSGIWYGSGSSWTKSTGITSGFFDIKIAENTQLLQKHFRLVKFMVMVFGIVVIRVLLGLNLA